MLRVTVRGAGALAAAVACWVVIAGFSPRGWVLAPLAASTTALLLVGAVTPLRARIGCRVVATAHPVPAVVEVGGSAVLRVTVVNVGRRHCPDVLLGSSARAVVAPIRPAASTTPLAPGGSQTIELPLPTARRGRLRGGPGQLWVLDPFAATGTVVAELPAWSLVVVPAAAPSGDEPVSAGSGSSPHSVEATGRAGDDGPGELVGLRPYRLGDRLHRLHWASLAPGRTPLVRTFGNAAIGTQVSLVLDDRAGVHHRDEFERVLACCLGVVDAYRQRGLVPEVRTLSGRRLTTPIGRGERVDLAVELALLEPAPPLRGDPLPPLVPAGPWTAVAVTSPTGARSLTPRLPAVAEVVVAR